MQQMNDDLVVICQHLADVDSKHMKIMQFNQRNISP